MLRLEKTASDTNTVSNMNPSKLAPDRRKRVLMVGTIEALNHLDMSSNATVDEGPVKASTGTRQKKTSVAKSRSVSPKTRRVVFRTRVSKRDLHLEALNLINPQATFDDEIFINDLVALQTYLSSPPLRKSASAPTSPTQAARKRSVRRIKSKKRSRKSLQQISPEMKQYIEARIASEDEFATALVLKHKKVSRKNKSRKRRVTRSNSRFPKTRALRNFGDQTRKSMKSQSDSNLASGSVGTRSQMPSSEGSLRAISTSSVSPPSKRSMLFHSRRRTFMEVAKAVIEGRIQENITGASKTRAVSGDTSKARSVEKIAALFEYRKRGSGSPRKKEKTTGRVAHNAKIGPDIKGRGRPKLHRSSVCVDLEKSSFGKRTSPLRRVKSEGRQQKNGHGSAVDSGLTDAGKSEKILSDSGYKSNEISRVASETGKHRPILFNKKNDLPTALKNSVTKDHSHKANRLKKIKKQVSFSNVRNTRVHRYYEDKEDIQMSSKSQKKLFHKDTSIQQILNNPTESHSDDKAKTSMAKLHTTNGKEQSRPAGSKPGFHVSLSEDRGPSGGKFNLEKIVTSNRRVRSDVTGATGGKEAPKGRNPTGSVTISGDHVTSKPTLKIGRAAKRVSSAIEPVTSTKTQGLPPKGILRVRSDTLPSKKSLSPYGLNSPLLSEILRISDMESEHPRPIMYVPPFSYDTKRSTFNKFLGTSPKLPKKKNKRRIKQAGNTGDPIEDQSRLHVSDESSRLPQNTEVTANSNNVGQTLKVKGSTGTLSRQSAFFETSVKSLALPGYVADTAVSRDANNSKDGDENAENAETKSVKNSTSNVNGEQDVARSSAEELADTTPAERDSLKGENHQGKEANTTEEVADIPKDSAEITKVQSYTKTKKNSRNAETKKEKKSRLKKTKPKPLPFLGWDGGKELAEHTMTKLPEYADVAAMLIKHAAKKKERQEMFLSGQLWPEPSWKTSEEDVKVYLAKHGVEGLLTDLTVSLLTDTPKRPIERMLDITDYTKKQADIKADIAARFPFLRSEQSRERVQQASTRTAGRGGGGSLVDSEDTRSDNSEDIISDSAEFMKLGPSRVKVLEQTRPSSSGNLAVAGGSAGLSSPVSGGSGSQEEFGEMGSPSDNKALGKSDTPTKTRPSSSGNLAVAGGSAGLSSPVSGGSGSQEEFDETGSPSDNKALGKSDTPTKSGISSDKLTFPSE